ncbi:cytochrome b [Ferrovum myxofaciens]|uniref:cytochrome b n=1 Tax=Ferrovum myxofaciens TaxID=416213 RepID=UPI003EB9B80F
MVLHWLTAALVLVLFSTAEFWNALPHGNKTRPILQSFHISLGLLLCLVIVTRIWWRIFRGKRLVVAPEAAKLVHRCLYTLLVTRASLGVLYRWAQAESFQLFGLVTLRFASTRNPVLAPLFGNLHNVTAWIIVGLALGHGGMALVHHYRLKDGILLRMAGGKEKPGR